MTLEPQPKPQVLVPYVCPVCAAPNEVHLISLSRAGGTDCAACGKWLKAADVMRAIHAPRTGPQVSPHRGAAPVAPETRARTATRGGSRPTNGVKEDAVVWPPTAASRAAVKPLYVHRR